MGRRAGGRASGIRDKIIGSDPGLGRLRSAVSAGVAIAGALSVEYGFARITEAGAQGTLVVMILGTVIAMMGTMALTGTAAMGKVWTAVFFPVAMGAGLAIGILVGSDTPVMLGVFVLVMFAAVYMRRYGPAFFFYGFMVWTGYFFAAFLHPTLGRMPSLIEAVAISSAWVLILSLTLLRTNTRRTLNRSRRAFEARARAVVRACAELLDAAAAKDTRRLLRLRRRLHARQLRLAEAALVIESWSAERNALPAGWSGPALRRRILDMQLAVETLAAAADSLAAAGGTATADAGAIARALADQDVAAVERLALPLLDFTSATPRHAGTIRTGGSLITARAGDGRWAAHHLAAAATEYVDLLHQADAPPVTEAADAGFAPAVRLAMGALPGSFGIAGSVAARGHSWNVFARMSLITRQAIQVSVAGALAILIGREISDTRYYWAVIAVFVAFTGTATRFETFFKATNRVVGTLVGLVAGIGLAYLTAGHVTAVLVVVVLSMVAGFYLVQVSYAAMIFFVTILVSQLYSVLHTFSAGLLVLRLEETAAGAAIAILVGHFVLPTSTRDTAHSARTVFFSAVAKLLRGVAGRLDGSEPPADVDALARAIDHQLRVFALVAGPLTRPPFLGVDSRFFRHRLMLYAALSRHSRALALAPQRMPDPASAAELAMVARSLADSAEKMAEALEPYASPRPDVEQSLTAAESALLGTRHSAPLPPIGIPLLQLCELLRDLASTRSGSGPKHRRPPRPKLRLPAASAAPVPQRAAAAPGRNGDR